MTQPPVPPARRPIAVTGIGVLTALGDRLDATVEALHEGRRAIVSGPESFASATRSSSTSARGRAAPGSCSASASVRAARIAGFDATRYAAVPGLRRYSRANRLGIGAAALALADAGLTATGLDGELGVVTASTFAHMETSLEFDRGVVTAGFQRTNPARMPLAIPGAPGAVIALSFGARAFSISVGDGGASSLDAVGLGVRLLAGGRARACVVVGAFAGVDELLLSAARAGMLAPPHSFLVIDRRRQGTVFGEAAAAVVLERPEDARARGALPRGFVRGQVSTLASAPCDVSAALARACAGALRHAGLSPSELGLVSAGANGSVEGDRAEAEALLEVLGEAAPRIPLTAVKASLGETVDAAGLLQAAVAIAALSSGRAPPIAGLEEPEVAGLGYAIRPAEVAAPHALVTATSHTGACSALAISGAGGGRCP